MKPFRLGTWSLCFLMVLSACMQTRTMNPVPEDWRKVTVRGDVSFFVPPSMEEVEVQPVDSAVGILRSETCELYYDYGAMAGDLSEYEQQEGAQLESAQIDGHRAQIIEINGGEQEEGWSYLIAGHFPSLSSSQKLTLRFRCNSPKPDVGRQILQSIRFHTDDS